ncbi:hypothetical protein KC316_g9877, partial [Hortaea werneckii]
MVALHLDRLPTGLTLLVLASSQLASGFYLPGITPTNYKTGDLVQLNVNHLTPAQSRDANVHSAFSFDYYHDAFHFCKPKGGPRSVSESLGSILFGDRIQTSPFHLKMHVNETCKAVCDEKVFEPRDAKFVNRRIQQNFYL